MNISGRPRSAILILAIFGAAVASSTPHAQNADAELKVFGQKFPHCQLWTDWRKMCSRTGVNGEVICASDLNKPVRPSAPFCAADEDGFVTIPRLDMSAVVRASADRYCDEFRGAGSNRHCTHYTSDRPFNGRHLASRRHAWCDIWADEGNWKPVCSEIGTPGLASCASLAKQHYQSHGVLYCAKRSEGTERNRWCGSFKGWGKGPDFPAQLPIEFTGLQSSGNSNVVGLFCSSRR